MLKRHVHPRSNTRLQSQDMGMICPTRCAHILEGSTISGDLTAALRFDPMVNPVFSRIDIFSWIVRTPLRILWKDYENFKTGGSTGNERPVPPYIVAPEGGFKVGSLADYLGCPTGVGGIKVSAIPFRAYALWWNTYIRKEQFQDELPISYESGEDTVTNTELQYINWSKDMFTTLAKEQQLGDEVVIPLEGSAPVNGPIIATAQQHDAGNIGVRWLNIDNGQQTPYTRKTFIGISGNGNSYGHTYNFDESWGAQAGTPAPSNLNLVNGTADLSKVSGVSPSQLKLALQRQMWKIKRNLYGSEYRDYLRFLGIRYSDARLQLPEVLARGRSTVDITEVLQTAPSTDSYVGSRAGRGTGFNRSSHFRAFCEEGFCLMYLTCLRPRTTYVNLPQMEWNFQVREDIYTPEFAHIGMKPYLKGDLFLTGTATDEQVLGYGNYYDEYRVGFNDVAGSFKTTDTSYHMGRIFANQPSLNSDFLKCVPTTRVFADMENVQHLKLIVENKLFDKSIVSRNGDPYYNL